MPKTLTMRVDDATYETFVRAAQAQRRSLANLIETAALRHLEEANFADDTEMAEILARPELVKRLKAASQDARKRRGRFAGRGDNNQSHTKSRRGTADSSRSLP
jgi:hypothetical protein